MYTNTGRAGRRKRKREMFHRLIHSSDSCNGWGRAWPLLGARSFQVSHVSAGTKALRSSSVALTESSIGNETTGTSS